VCSIRADIVFRFTYGGKNSMMIAQKLYFDRMDFVDIDQVKRRQFLICLLQTHFEVVFKNFSNFYCAAVRIGRSDVSCSFVCPSVSDAHTGFYNLNTRRRRKTKIGANVSWDRSNQCAICAQNFIGKADSGTIYRHSSLSGRGLKKYAGHEVAVFVANFRRRRLLMLKISIFWLKFPPPPNWGFSSKFCILERKFADKKKIFRQFSAS